MNARIEARIFAHAGQLTDGDLHPSFGMFLGHYRFLSLAFDASKERKEMPAGDFKHYPSDLDKHVETTYNELRNERETLRKRDERLEG